MGSERAEVDNALGLTSPVTPFSQNSNNHPKYIRQNKVRLIYTIEEGSKMCII